jgi:hypothetical protein
MLCISRVVAALMPPKPKIPQTRPRACGSACRVAAAERRIENDRKSNANRGRAGLERAQLELSVIESQLLCAASSATMTTMRGRLVPVIKLMWLLPAGGRPSRQSGGWIPERGDVGVNRRGVRKPIGVRNHTLGACGAAKTSSITRPIFCGSVEGPGVYPCVPKPRASGRCGHWSP